MAAKKPDATELEQLEEMCAEHFPHGWRHVADHQAGVACEHGAWNRPDPAIPPADPNAPPAP